MVKVKDLDDWRGEENIDSRDLIETLDDLCATLDGGEDIGEDGRELFHAIRALADEVGGEWECGAHLIREDRFEDYARELAEDVGAITGDEQWPANCIDWERAARELAMDYSSVSFLGHDYYVRS